MILIGAASVLPAAFFSDLGYAFCGEPMPKKEAIQQHKSSLDLQLFRTNNLLPLLFVLIIVTQIFSAVASLNFQGMLQVAYPIMDEQTAFSGKFFSWLNGLAIFFPFVMVPVIMRYISIANIHFFIPIVHLATSIAAIFYPSLLTSGTSYMAFKVFDYSLFRAAKEILYIPFSFDVRYRAKEVIDMFGYRMGKGGMSFIIVILQRFGLSSHEINKQFRRVFLGSKSGRARLHRPGVERFPHPFPRSWEKEVSAPR